MALVRIPTETRTYTQTYIFNRNIDASGNVTDAWGTSSRSVVEETVTYRGDYAAVLAAVAGDENTVVRKIDGPWYEATTTEVSYGEWVTVMNTPDDEEEVPT